MLKRLKRIFIAISMLAMIITVSGFYIALTCSNYKKAIEEADTLTSTICNHNGQIPEYTNNEFSQREREYITPESKFSTRYVVFYYDESGSIVDCDMSHIASISEEEAKEISREVVEDGKETGFYKSFRYRVEDTENGKIVVLLDYSGRLSYLKNTTSRGVIIIIIGLICIFIVISMFSNKVIEPMEKNLEKQKEFVTNAGHDLKTPVAVILADIEVLEMSLGEDNEWLNSIKRQAIKMDNLTKGLLNMSKLEDGNIVPEKKEFSVSDLVSDELQDLKTLAKEKNLTINFEKNDAVANADRNLIRQVVVVLIDNAIKYADENGKIDIKVKQLKKDQVQIEVINDYKDYKNFNKDRVFDRFYRGDKSRNSEKNSGYGIGLSMAKSIVEAHKGKIKAELTKDCRVCFTVVI